MGPGEPGGDRDRLLAPGQRQSQEGASRRRPKRSPFGCSRVLLSCQILSAQCTWCPLPCLGLASLLALQCCTPCPPYTSSHQGGGPFPCPSLSAWAFVNGWSLKHQQCLATTPLCWNIHFFSAFCGVCCFVLVLICFGFFLLPGLVSGFWLLWRHSQEGWQMSCSSWGFEISTAKNGQSFSASRQAWRRQRLGTAEAMGGNISLRLLITLNGAMLGGCSLFATLTWGGQERIKRSIIKAYLDLKFFPSWVPDRKHSAAKSPKRPVRNSHLVFM